MIPRQLDARESGQSTVEFALVLPFVLLLLLGLIQAGVFIKDVLLVSGAAREAAREAAVTAEEHRIVRAAERAAPGLELKLEIDRGPRRGDPVSVIVTARPSAVPLVGAIVESRAVTGRATMRVEQPST